MYKCTLSIVNQHVNQNFDFEYESFKIPAMSAFSFSNRSSSLYTRQPSLIFGYSKDIAYRQAAAEGMFALYEYKSLFYFLKYEGFMYVRF